MFAGPKQPDFFCSTPNNLAGFGLPPFPIADCSLADARRYYYRPPTDDLEAVRPGSAAAGRHDRRRRRWTAQTVDFVVRWERGTIDRFIYTIAVSRPRPPDRDVDLPYWNRKLHLQLRRRRRDRPLPGSNNAADESRYPYGLGKGYAIAWSTGHEDEHALQPRARRRDRADGQVALRHGVRRAALHRRPSAAPAARSSSTSTARTIPGLLDGAIPQYSYPDMVTQTIHVGDCELLEHWMDSKVLANPLSKWRDVGRTARWSRGSQRSSAIAEPVPAADAVACRAGLDRVHQRLARPLAARAQPAVRHGARDHARSEQRTIEWTHWDDPVNVYGTRRDGLRALAVGQRRRPVRAAGAARPARSRPREFLDLNANVGAWKRVGGHGAGGLPVRRGRVHAGNVDVWSARNMNLSPDGGATPAPRREGDIEAMHAAYRSRARLRRRRSTSRSSTGATTSRTSSNMHNAHQSFAARQRMLNTTATRRTR